MPFSSIARTTPQVDFPAGHTLWKTGDRSDHTVILLTGTVTCTTQWGLSRFRAGPGYPLGNLERFSRDPRWYTGITETPCKALMSYTEPLLDVFEDNFDLSLGFLRSMALRLIDLSRETGSRYVPSTGQTAAGQTAA